MFDKDKFLNEVSPLFTMKIKFRGSELPFNTIYMTDAKKNVVLRRLDIDKQFERAWNFNYSQIFYTDMMQRLSNQSNITMRYYGDANSGKSYASIYMLQLQREFFDFGYHIVFSKGEAAGILATETYKAKHNELTGKFTILLDEDYKRFGVGSIQEMEYFQSMQEFLRRAQINLIMNNPFDISSAEVQFETIGYTIPNDKGESFTKSIVYYLVDKRNNIYSPMGYVLTKRPSLPYLDAYEQQKKKFLINFTANRSPIIEKNKSLLEIIHKSMDKDTQEMVKESILLGKDNDTRTLLWEAISEFNMPTAYTKQLIESYKMLYYKTEIKQAWEMKKQRILARQGGY
jgi:DNA polymerase III epsilon subunit-like protein